VWAANSGKHKGAGQPSTCARPPFAFASPIIFFSSLPHPTEKDYITSYGGDPLAAETKDELLVMAASLGPAAGLAGNGGGVTATAAMTATAAQPPPPPGPPSGRKRALLVACNYAGTSAQLGGCINDAACLAHCLTTRFGFRPADVVQLLDTSPDPAAWPTRHNILAAAHALAASAGPGDSLFFSFSGHGTQVPDPTGDEADGMNEAILPCDHEVAGYIIDDELNTALVNPLPPGAKLHAVLDACHAGSMLDLEWRAKARDGPIYWKQEYTHAPVVYKGTAGGWVVAFSAARDKQTAADTAALSGTGAHTGAATYAFIAALEATGGAGSYGELLARMKATLDAVNPGAAGPVGGAAGGGMLGRLLTGLLDAAGASGQTPAITSNLAFDLNAPFAL
jgi:hypothetical protein